MNRTGLSRSLALLALVLCLFAAAANAQENIPQANAKGDFQGRYLHNYWMVMDPDPNGFNGRLTPKWPANWDAVDANWPDTRVIKPDWPVVVRFNRGRVLRAMSGNMGLIFIRDGRGLPWLMVSAGPAGKPNGVCFVRANAKFLKPVLAAENGRNLPSPDPKGNYAGVGLQKYWKVVADGLQGRRAPSWPANWDAVNANWPDTKGVAQWPAVCQIARNEVLLAGMGNRGVITVQDAAGNPWMLVTTGPGSSGSPAVCFIPANAKYIKPVNVVGN